MIELLVHVLLIQNGSRLVENNRSIGSFELHGGTLALLQECVPRLRQDGFARKASI